MTTTHTFQEVQDAESQEELLALADSDERIEQVGEHSGFIWFSVDDDILVDIYMTASPMTNIQHGRYDGMTIGIAHTGHSALN